MDKIIVIDAEQCMACLTCEIECSLAHSQSKDLGEAMNEVEPRINVEAAQEFAVPMVCRHCEDAPCVKICPTKALSRQEANAPVLLKQDLCIERLKAGQEPACVASCPMDAIKFVEAEQYVREKRMAAAGEISSSFQKNNKKEEQKEKIQ